jgi:hypothetical protein
MSQIKSRRAVWQRNEVWVDGLMDDAIRKVRIGSRSKLDHQPQAASGNVQIKLRFRAGAGGDMLSSRLAVLQDDAMRFQSVLFRLLPTYLSLSGGRSGLGAVITAR